MSDPGRQALQDAKLIRIELVIAEIEREKLCLDSAKFWLTEAGRASSKAHSHGLGELLRSRPEIYRENPDRVPQGLPSGPPPLFD